MDEKLLQIINNFVQELIGAVPEFNELSQAREALVNDSSSQQLWEEKEEMRQTVDLLKKQDLPVSQHQEEQLSLKLKEMRENPVTMRYLKSINFASKVSGKIGAELLDIMGVDFAPRKGCK